MRELLFSVTKKDFEITYFSGSGAGGQYRNKHQNCCRIKHRETGLMATGQDERSKEQNTKNAFKRLVNSPKFQNWLKIKAAEVMASRPEKSVAEQVEEAMKPENLKVEYIDIYYD
jgi:peptide chain release factor 1